MLTPERSNSESHAKAEAACQAPYPHRTNSCEKSSFTHAFKLQSISQLYSLQKLPLSLTRSEHLQPKSDFSTMSFQGVSLHCAHGIRGALINH